ncbi:MAG: peptidoglycan editing factor PgeF [Candidatus Omnitrophica bacterium]|nr:peptidoglycan editing factor PgeF [Candidatus Omnitrophota bacterium]
MLPASQSTTTRFSRDFFPPHVVAFVSDRSADFKLSKDAPELTKPQNTFLTRQLGFRVPEVLTVRQVHGHKIVVAARGAARKSVALEEADGILTDRHNLAIAVRTADCLSVFIYDPRNDVIGLIHAGWRGTQQQIIKKAMTLMRAHWDSRPRDLRVAFGPAIRSCCYQVASPFLEYFPRETVKRKQGYFFDLPQANRNQLAEAGVDAANIMDCGVCTHCDPEYFSYRREGEAAGRMISLMMVRK